MDELTAIPLARLFVCEPDPTTTNRYAFDIREIENYVTTFGQVLNFYTESSFSPNDLRKLFEMSSLLKTHIMTLLNNSVSHISPQTIYEMDVFVSNAAKPSKKLRKVMEKKYKKSELREMQQARVDLNDLIRGEVFSNFKDYYRRLDEKEKTAIDNFPGVKLLLKSYHLGDSLSNIFNLPADSCLGGAAGVCKKIINTLKIVDDLKKNYRQISPQKESSARKGFFYKSKKISDPEINKPEKKDKKTP
ncbi:hypothetical protein [Legionella nautarum]|nr:hypothetical protein [Legionella nautarum]